MLPLFIIYPGGLAKHCSSPGLCLDWGGGGKPQGLRPVLFLLPKRSLRTLRGFPPPFPTYFSSTCMDTIFPPSEAWLTMDVSGDFLLLLLKELCLSAFAVVAAATGRAWWWGLLHPPSHGPCPLCQSQQVRLA